MDRLTGDFKGASMFATVEQARIYNKLRQYEDTGLTPEEIAALRAELDALKSDIEAGRMVRYPCRPGDTVWTIWRDVPEMTLHAERVDCMLDEGDGPRPCKYYEYEGPGEIRGAGGGDYYLTQGEAEAARAALEGGQHGTDQT